jgi:hypothetical protein
LVVVVADVVGLAKESGAIKAMMERVAIGKTRGNHVNGDILTNHICLPFNNQGIEGHDTGPMIQGLLLPCRKRWIKSSLGVTFQDA